MSGLRKWNPLARRSGWPSFDPPLGSQIGCAHSHSSPIQSQRTLKLTHYFYVSLVQGEYLLTLVTNLCAATVRTEGNRVLDERTQLRLS